MRILIIFLLLSCCVYPQRLINTPYETRMDSIGLAHLQLKFDTIIHKEKIMTWRPYQRLKVTMKTRVNRSIISKLDLSDNGNGVFDNLEADDYWSIAAYDIRAKYYVNKIWRITARVMLTGVESSTYFYSNGIVLKF